MKFLIPILLLVIFSFQAPTEHKLADAFVKSLQQEKFEVLTPFLPKHEQAKKMLHEKWNSLVQNIKDNQFPKDSLQAKRVLAGKSIPGLPMKPMVITYKLNGKEWDDIMILVNEKEDELLDIPNTSYMFTGNEDRIGRNLKDVQ